MLRRTFPLLLVFVIALAVALQAESTDFLPAGTLLSCTMDEPNFSSKTAEVGDPVLCYLGMTTVYGRTMFPRGASIGGHLEDDRNPGHFFGKGSLTLEFDRLILPGEGILPFAGKVIAVPHYKVERNGKIDGKGHAKRDAVEWAIPVLWPIKILTLPARGPYPTLKGETRLTMRLMEDVAIPVPQPRALNKVPMPPWASPTSLNTTNSDFHVMNAAVQQVQLPQNKTNSPTLIILNDHSAYLVDSYWLEGDAIRYRLQDGDKKAVALSDVDFATTIQVNRERGVGFMLQSFSNPTIEAQ
jgi:hypothetical protein